MSTDLNDQFATRCYDCGAVVKVSDAVRQRVMTGTTSHYSASGNSTHSSTRQMVDLCRKCSDWRQSQQAAMIAAAPKVAFMVIAILATVGLLFFGSIALMFFISRYR